MVVHSVILLPGNQLTYFCKDGLSPLDADNVGRILNFGGSIKAVDCGASNEFATLWQAVGDMNTLAVSTSDPVKKSDYESAYLTNIKNTNKLMNSPVYQSWIYGKSLEEQKEMAFQAYA